MRIPHILSAVTCSLLAAAAIAQMPSVTAVPQAPTPSAPYKILNTVAAGGAGGFDYVYADSDGRKLYIPRSNRVDVFDLDTLKPAGSIADANNVHGAVVDSKSHRGFASSSPVVMWDTTTLKTVKTIDVKGKPDGILFDPATQHVLILSHSQPNATIIDSTNGNILGTLDLGGEPEQGAADGNGTLYISLEDKGTLAVVDDKTLKVTAHYDLNKKAGGLAGLAIDAKNHILFSCGREPATCTILNATDGAVITTLPIGDGVDSAEFNPNTMEAFASTRDGKLTIIKETDPKTFAVEQTLTTMPGAKTCTLDAKTDHVLLITSDRTAAATAPAPAVTPNARPMRGAPAGVFTILVAGRPEDK